MNKVKNSWLNLIALLVLALFAANAAQKKRTPVYHSTLDSAAAIETPAVGATGVCWNVEFRAGVKGNALYVPAGTSTVKVPFNDGLPAQKGCIEFWAKILPSGPSFIDGGNPRFFNFTAPGADACSTGGFLEANANNGGGRGGWHLWLSNVSLTTGPWGAWQYSQIFGDLDYADWHHYAIKWNVQGLSASPDMGIVFELDGNAMLSQPKDGMDVATFCATLSQPLELLFPLQYNTRLPSDCRVPYLIDEFKVWDSDVFAEESPDQPEAPLYCVIDLSGGTAAEDYPITYLDAEPEGGWSGAYKTGKLVMRRIEPGGFLQSDSEGSTVTPSIQRTRPCVISNAFYIGVFELTQAQYKKVFGDRSFPFAGDTRPADYISYDEIRGASIGAQYPSTTAVDPSSVIGVLRARTGLSTLDLPTEAQWEYACRAGTTSSFNNGGTYAADLKTLGRYAGDNTDGKGGYSGQHTAVGSYLPNAWGLYDMHGNVWEWCCDWGSIAFEADVIACDPLGAESGTRRALRGGSWDASFDYQPSYVRHSDYPNSQGNYGIRLVFSAADLAMVVITPEPDPGTAPGTNPDDPALNDGVDAVDGVTWYYTLADGNATIVKGAILYAGELTTPMTLDGHPVKAIGENAFRACPDLVSVVVSDGVETVGRGAFAEDSLLTSVTMPDSVTYIAQDCFYKSSKLSQMNLPPHITIVSLFSFHNTALTEIVIPEGVTTIADCAFWLCEDLKEVKLPSTLTFIDWGAFHTCPSLKSIEFPAALERFGVWTLRDEAHAAFGNCTGLEEAIFNGPLPTNFAYSWILRPGCKIWYPKAYEAQWAAAVPAEYFGGYTEDYGLEPGPEPDDPDPALNDGVDVVDGVTWYYTLDDNGNATIVKGAILYAGDLTTPQMLDGHPVKGIAQDGFIDCTGLTSIVVQDGVEYIGNGAFARCPSLVRAILPDSATNIVESCFYQCYSLAEYRIPQRLPFICRFFFHGTAIKKIDIPEGVARIGDNAFWLCEQLEEVTLPSTLTFIDWSAFHSCPLLKRIEFPEGFEGFGVWTLRDEAHAAFGNCTGLEEVIFNGPLPTNFTYSWLDKLGCKIWYPKAYEASWAGAVPAEKFGGYTEDYGNEPGPGPDDPSLNDGVDVIDGVTWYYTLADGVATIVKGAILYAGELTTPTTLDGHPVKAIGENAFRACSDLVSVVVSDGVETVGRSAFSYNPLLTSVTLPDSVTFIDVDGFYSSTSLSVINLPPHLTSVSNFTFHDTALTEVVIPEGVTSVGNCAFWPSTQLTTVTFPSTLKFIDWGAFNTCALTKIEFPEGFEGFGVWTLRDEAHAAFGACSNLREAIFNGPLPANFTYSWLDKLGCKIWYPRAYEASWAGAVPAEKFGGYTEDYGNEPGPGPDDPDPALNDGVDVIDGVTWYYSLADGVATIVKGAILYAGELTTPMTLDGHPVKAIGENAFRACPDLVSVVVSDGVETVGRSAFSYNPLLTSVTLPDSVTFIDVDGFYSSTSLSVINLPPHLTSVSNFTFHDTALTEVVIPEGVTSVGNCAFWPSTQLMTVTFPSTLKFIDWGAFNTCALTKIEFPEGFEGFGVWTLKDEAHAAFGNCTNLSEAIFNGPLPTNFTYSWLDKLGCKIWYPKAYEESWAGAVPAEKFGGYTEDYGKEPEPEPEPEEIEFKTIADGGYDIGVAIEPVAVTYNGGAANAKIALAGLPNGLAFKNGAISGVPTMPGFYTVKATVAVGKKTVAERSVKMRVKNYTDPLAEGLPDDLGEFIPGVAVDITLEPVKGWKAVTLPAGLKFAPSTGRITGAPTKPGVFTVCFTKTYGYAVHAASSTMTVLPLRRLVVAKEGSGTVKGAGRYLANAKVKLTATPAKKMAVEGWYKDGVRVSRNAAYTYTMTADDEQTLVAKFVSVAEDRKSLTCTVADGATIASGKYITVTNYQGVAFSMPIAFSALTKPTVSVKGLPKGLKYAGGEIKGASTVASKKDKKGRYVATATTFTLKTLAGNSAKYSVRFVTLPRPAWAVGTYDGAYNSEDALAGRSTLSVAATGAVSGKVFARIGGAGVTATLAAASIKAYDEARGVFLVEATMKGAGIEACKVEFTLAKGENGLGEAVAAADGDAMWLVQNVWKRTALKAPAFNTKKPLSLRLANGLALKFGANGAVTFSGKVAGDDGEPVAVSGSAQLIACWDEESGTNAKLVVYAAPRANLANGVAEEIELHLKKNAKNVVTGVTEVTAAPALP